MAVIREEWREIKVSSNDRLGGSCPFAGVCSQSGLQKVSLEAANNNMASHHELISGGFFSIDHFFPVAILIAFF